jgi:Zn-dependent membrane protease YugP
MYIDYSYIIYVLPAVIFAGVINLILKSTFNKYSQIPNNRSITGAKAAEIVLQYYNVHDVQIEKVSGNLTDHYDPRCNVIRLSENVYDNPSIAAVGVACHEAGHAAQHAESYMPIKLRNLILPVCKIGSKLATPLFVIGLILSFTELIWVGICLFSFTTIFQLATLPVEFNASKRAIKVIESTDILATEEVFGAKKVLKMAAMTYVAALAVSFMQLLKLVLRYGNRKR